MKLEKSKIKKILVISLSNIGDVILTFPVIDILKNNFPESTFSLVIGPKAEELFLNNPHISKVYIFNKRQPLTQMIRWICKLRKERFDLVVDLRNTAIPFLIHAKYTTPLEWTKIEKIHMKHKHLNRLKKVFDYPLESEKHFALSISSQDKGYIDVHVKKGENFIVIAPGAANHLKRWKEEGFAKVADHLRERYQVKIIFVGDKTDELIADRIQKQMKHQSLNLCAKTTLTQLAALLERSVLMITNDSGVMHMASYLGLPVVAIFGPSDPLRYGPWSKNSKVVKSTAFCQACHQPKGSYAHTCMGNLESKEVLSVIKEVIENSKKF